MYYVNGPTTMTYCCDCNKDCIVQNNLCQVSKGSSISSQEKKKKYLTITSFKEKRFFIVPDD